MNTNIQRETDLRIQDERIPGKINRKTKLMERSRRIRNSFFFETLKSVSKISKTAIEIMIR